MKEIVFSKYLLKILNYIETFFQQNASFYTSFCSVRWINATPQSVLRRGPWMGGQSAYRRLYSPFYVKSSITAAYRIEKVSVQGLNLEPCAKEANALTVRVNALTAESSVKFRCNSLEDWNESIDNKW